ncbi:YihY family inner membrane protein [Sulfurospirillum sp. T05]|uniref:YihY family inner membrane protein n=1 Tax=Sulfurospirillum tamanense TaxID=2813362 RepID=A0ABS2WQB1_9BACT|nr:YihY family inner membrane protein [Sulfurospirillum tamanensis]MBN2963871.1 YihY family inner membrane protein [Sulfurospirillum tamanensis]
MRFLHYVELLKKIKDKQLMHYASSLSFHTMLSLIPVLLISMSIFTQLPSFEVYYEKMTAFIFSSLLPSHQEVISGYIETFLSNTVGMGVLGFVVVLFTSMMFFLEYEYIINTLLNAKRRSFWQSLSSYWTLITLAPLGLGVSFYISGVLHRMLQSSDFTKWINILAIFPYLIVWALFFATYMISSGKHLSPRLVALASFIASLIWYLCKNLFVYYVAYNTSYLSIYGSFSVVVFFFVWIYLSWIIFLYGVKLCAFLEEQKGHSTQENNPHRQEAPADSQYA